MAMRDHLKRNRRFFLFFRRSPFCRDESLQNARNNRILAFPARLRLTFMMVRQVARAINVAGISWT